MRLPRPFQRFAAPTPPEPKPQTTLRGGSGRWHTNGFLQLEELNAELQHPQGHTVFDRMWRTDPDVRRSLAMALNPILSATWSIEPYGGDDATDLDIQAADAARWALFEFMKPGLLGHLAEALPLVARSGFAPFEQLWAPTTYEGRQLIAPAKLALRLPRSVVRWFQDELEQLTGIEQMTLTHGPDGKAGLVTLDASNLVYYRVGAEGDNWEGVSMLRPAYKPWFLKDNLEKLDAIANELEGVGLPIIYPPRADIDQETLDDLETKVADIRAGETSYLMMPGPRSQDLSPDQAEQGWFFDIIGRNASSGKSGRDASGSLSYHSDKIAAALIAEFMRLGHAGVGARATAQVQKDPFLAAVEGFVSSVIEPQLNALVARFATLNFAEIDGPPKLSMSLVDSTSLTDLATYVLNLWQAGALHPDDELEDYLRDRADLPPADADAREQRHQQEEAMQKAAAAAAAKPPVVPGAQDEAAPGNTGTEDAPAPGNAAQQTHARQTRPLRSYEQHMSLDDIEQAIDGARAQFQAAAADPARAAAASVAATIAAGRKPKPQPPDELTAALHTELLQLYALGQRTVDDELARQGAHGPAQDVQTHARLAAAAKGLARRAAAAARECMSAIIRAADRADMQGLDHAGMQAAAEQAAASALRAEAVVHAAPALNAGRADQAAVRSDEIAGARYTSILDGNTCDRCAAADDDVLRPLTDPVLIARTPPNRECEGGDRCRCMLAYQLKDEAAPSA